MTRFPFNKRGGHVNAIFIRSYFVEKIRSSREFEEGTGGGFPDLSKYSTGRMQTGILKQPSNRSMPQQKMAACQGLNFFYAAQKAVQSRQSKECLSSIPAGDAFLNGFQSLARVTATRRCLKPGVLGISSKEFQSGLCP